MALFNIPTPSEIRTNLSREIQGNAFGLARLPRGRGFVASAGQAGGFLGTALGKALGGKLPEEERAAKLRAIQERVSAQAEIDKLDFSKPTDQLQFFGNTAMELVEGGFPDEAIQAIGLANQIRSTLPKPARRKEKDRFGSFQDIPGTNLIGQINLDTNLFSNIKEKNGRKKDRIGKGITPVEVSKNDLVNAAELTRNKTIATFSVDDQDVEFTSDRFDNDEMKVDYENAIAQRAKAYQGQATLVGQTLGFDEAVNLAEEDMRDAISLQEETFSPDDIIFNKNNIPPAKVLFGENQQTETGAVSFGSF